MSYLAPTHVVINKFQLTRQLVLNMLKSHILLIPFFVELWGYNFLFWKKNQSLLGKIYKSNNIIGSLLAQLLVCLSVAFLLLMSSKLTLIQILFCKMRC